MCSWFCFPGELWLEVLRESLRPGLYKGQWGDICRLAVRGQGMTTNGPLRGQSWKKCPSSVSMWVKPSWGPPTDAGDTPWALADSFLRIWISSNPESSSWSVICFSSLALRVFSFLCLLCEQGYINRAKMKVVLATVSSPGAILLASVQFPVVPSETNTFCPGGEESQSAATLSQRTK